MLNSIANPLDSYAKRVREDLFVQAVSVQGGEADLAGEKAAFARITLSGHGCDSPVPDARATRRQETALLKLTDAEELATQLGEVLNVMSRSSAARVAPAMGLWSWRAEPPLDDDVLVVGMEATVVAIREGAKVSPTVRLELIGMPVGELRLGVPPIHFQRAIFSGSRQVQSLISSLKKVARSAREQQRLDVYVPQDRPVGPLLLIS